MKVTEDRLPVDSAGQCRYGESGPLNGPFISDAVLAELKKQSTAGCLLCAFDERDAEDWE